MPPKEFKIVILGSGGVGKSSLTIQYVQNYFIEKYDPTIEDSYTKQVEIAGRPYKLEILDTAGTERFTAMRDLYMKNGQGFLIVYSMVAASTYNDTYDLCDTIFRVKDTEKVPMVLVANKCDLDEQRIVSRDEGEEMARRINCCPYFETSAKENINVEAVFTNLVNQMEEAFAHNPADKKKPAQKGCVLM